MAINSKDISCDRRSSKSQSSSKCFKQKLVKTDFATEGSICSVAMKHGKYNNKPEYKSPYLSGDSVQLLSQLTEKRRVYKKGGNIVSTLPVAANIIYKANSDHFKDSKKYKKTQKSVLTIPNNHTPGPQLCTVSDMNESDYFNRNDGNHKKNKKRSPASHTRKYRIHGKDFKLYDRDAQYCSQMNVMLDCSSTDIIKTFNLDENISKSEVGSRSRIEEKANPHDVWAVLRNINRFEFRPSPPASEDTFISSKKKKGPKSRDNKNDMRVFERCCTEEFAYISSFEVDRKSSCSFLSQVCSTDTVIEKKINFNKISEKSEKKQTKRRKNGKLVKPSTTYYKNVAKNKTLHSKLNNNKKIVLANQKDNKCENDYGESSLVMCPENDEDKTLAERNTLHQGIENKIFTNNNVHDTPQSSQYGDLIYSGTSESETIKVNKRTASMDRKVTNKSQVESNQPINGITKVVVCNGPNDVPSNRITPTKRKPFQTTTLNNQPKLTNTEVRRLLNKQKFPVVILGKNELSSTFEVSNEEPPQFNGLSEHIWPFMLNWYGKEPNKAPNAFKTKHFEANGQTKKSKQVEVRKNIESMTKNKPRQSRFKEKKPNNELQCPKIKIGHKVPVKLADDFDQSQEQVKSKSIRKFRDRMLKLLYKNSSSALSVIDGSLSSDTVKNKNNNTYKVNICSNTGVGIDEMNSRKTIASSTLPTKYSSAYKHPWAKAKWASDFIENVISKIKTGVYYTHDSKVTTQINDHGSKEVQIQTISTCDLHNQKSVTIPGFDNVQSPVEIKTMNMNEISVKHCVTNCVVHFDVTVPTVSTASMKKSCSLIPVNVTDSHTKNFKCKTSILNAMLPAQLCSLLPKMLHNIAELREQFPCVSIPIEKPLYLSTISEVTHCESSRDINSNKNSMLHKVMPRELWRLVNGGFMNIDKMYRELQIVQNSSLSIEYERKLIQELVPDINRASLLYFNIIVNPIMPLTTVNTQENTVTPLNKSNKHNNTCTALQPCLLSEHRFTSFKPSNFTPWFNNMVNFINYNGASCLSNHINFITISTTTRHNMNVQSMLSLDNSIIKMDFPSDRSDSFVTNNKITLITNTINKTSKELNKCVDYANIASTNDEKKDTVLIYVSKNNNKTRSKSFVRHYKKCKSTSIIYGEKGTPLSQITNLDDFFQALGSGKLLSTVFDSVSGQKIMSSIQDMKNWTTEINPRQALLILLLTNKKDTSNLLRYKQVLLQGIAVNRITKSDELDMEIEVIERENLYKHSQYEGISYLPASIEHQDNLFEELCWIAKTTASDYQKPFEESSSVELLKSLLEKRKKLNPSYLRVMARYVGLGLLKPPGRK